MRMGSLLIGIILMRRTMLAFTCAKLVEGRHCFFDAWDEDPAPNPAPQGGGFFPQIKS
jgi:hypothetical protein